jgi:hypothetical protein
MDICSSKVQENKTFTSGFRFMLMLTMTLRNAFEICHGYVSSHHPDAAVMPWCLLLDFLLHKNLICQELCDRKCSEINIIKNFSGEGGFTTFEKVNSKGF